MSKPEKGNLNMGVKLTDEVLTSIRMVAQNIHHGRIIIEINTDKPNKVDVCVEYRERFEGVTVTN